MSQIFGRASPFRLRLRAPNTSIWRKYSLASRIRSLLPELDSVPFEEDVKHYSTPKPIPTLLAENDYLEATKLFVANSSMNTFEKDLESDVYAHLTSSFSKQEIQFCLIELGLGTLVIEEKTRKEVEVYQMLAGSTFSPTAWDHILFRKHGTHFPNVLWSKTSSLWLKTKVLELVLAQAPQDYALLTLRRYINQLQGFEPVAYLGMNCFGLVSKVVLERNDETHILAVLNGTTKETLRSVWQKIASKKIRSKAVLELSLRKAIHFKLTYEVKRIVEYAPDAFSSSLLSRALLAVAWGQRNIGDDVSLTTTAHIKTELTTSLLQKIPTPILKRVFYFALSTQPPPNILWCLLLSWERARLGSWDYHITNKIAATMSERPHLEQLRYLALESTNQDAISYLLNLNIRNIHVKRKEQNIDHFAVIPEYDMKLLVGGMVLMSEKTGVSKSTKPFGKVVESLFTNWNHELTENFIKTLYDYHKPTPQVTLAMIGMLLKHKSYTQAVQLLHIQPTSDLPPHVFHRLLLQVCKDFPEISTLLTTWLTSVVRVYLPPQILRNMIMLLSKRNKLSDRQAMLRINSVLKLLRGQKAPLGPEAAAAIVDGLLDRAMLRPGGSRTRLQWALDMCKEENVPQTKVKEWVEVINQMRVKSEGYWWHKGTKT